MRAVQRFTKAMKKAEGINESTDLSERDKATQIQKLMAVGSSKQKKAKPKVKVVVAKGTHRGVKGRPKGVKGKYLMVDARMRKEVSSFMVSLPLPVINGGTGESEETYSKAEQKKEVVIYTMSVQLNMSAIFRYYQ
jgi:hypothetical protein